MRGTTAPHERAISSMPAAHLDDSRGIDLVDSRSVPQQETFTMTKVVRFTGWLMDGVPSSGLADELLAVNAHRPLAGLLPQRRRAIADVMNDYRQTGISTTVEAILQT